MNQFMRYRWGFLFALLMIPVLACGSLAGGVKQVKEVAKTAKEVATTVAESNATEPTATSPEGTTPAPIAEETTVPTAEGTTVPSAGGTKEEVLHNTLNNIVKLAPVHATSLWATYKGKDLQEKFRVEMDIDTNGNRHIFIFQGDKSQTEIIAFDNDLYIRNGPDEQFLLLPGQTGEADLGYLAAYGAPWIVFFNDVKNAKKVGHESVNGFSADKYDTKFNTLGMGGILGAAAAAQGGIFDYKGNAWIETKNKALVKATVDITVKEKGKKVPTILQIRYDVKKARVEPVQKPTDVFSPPSMPGS